MSFGIGATFYIIYFSGPAPKANCCACVTISPVGKQLVRLHCYHPEVHLSDYPNAVVKEAAQSMLPPLSQFHEALSILQILRQASPFDSWGCQLSWARFQRPTSRPNILILASNVSPIYALILCSGPSLSWPQPFERNDAKRFLPSRTQACPGLGTVLPSLQ